MSSPLNIGIAGAGLLGRLVAWTLARQGHRVSVFDPALSAQPVHDGHGAAAFTAAGMLSPLAELETAEADVAKRGWHSIERWAQITADLATRHQPAPHFSRMGSLMVAHGSDLGAAKRVLVRLVEQQNHTHAAHQVHTLDATSLAALEPCLHSAQGLLHAWMLPGEGHIDAVHTMQCLHDDAPGVAWHWSCSVNHLTPGMIEWVGSSGAPQSLPFDWVFDLRGVGAKSATPVRGVRGELVWLHAPDVNLQRPVRLLHPRHRVYIVPRPNQVLLVGASEIETEDRSSMSLRSAVELMAAAHSVMPGLAEARILRLDTNLRPALPNNRPECHVEPGLVRINGLYRHGWLLAPSMVDEALSLSHLNAPLHTGTQGTALDAAHHA